MTNPSLSSAVRRKRQGWVAAKAMRDATDAKIKNPDTSPDSIPALKEILAEMDDRLLVWRRDIRAETKSLNNRPPKNRAQRRAARKKVKSQ